MRMSPSLFSTFSRIAIAITSIATILTLNLLTSQSVSAQIPSYVRVIHASPYVGTADVFVDGALLLSSFQFAAVTDYVAVPAGAHKVQIALLGKGINAAVITQELSVQPGFAYTVAATGDSPTTVGLNVFIDNNILAAKQAKVRIYQLSPDAGAINVAIGEAARMDNLAYQQASNYAAVPTGPCTFDVTVSQFNTTLPLQEELKPNTVTSVFTVGLFNGSPKIQLVAAQTAGVPGLPGTGSDPGVHNTTIWQVIPLWALGITAFVTLVVSVVTRRRQLLQSK